MGRKVVSNERGAVLIESVFSLAVLIPLLSGMIMVGQLYQERALMAQALRSSTRPVSFFRSIGVTAEEEDQPRLHRVSLESESRLCVPRPTSRDHRERVPGAGRVVVPVAGLPRLPLPRRFSGGQSRPGPRTLTYRG